MKVSLFFSHLENIPYPRGPLFFLVLFLLSPSSSSTWLVPFSFDFFLELIALAYVTSLMLIQVRTSLCLCLCKHDVAV